MKARNWSTLAGLGAIYFAFLTGMAHGHLGANTVISAGGYLAGNGLFILIMEFQAIRRGRQP